MLVTDRMPLFKYECIWMKIGDLRSPVISFSNESHKMRSATNKRCIEFV